MPFFRGLIEFALGLYSRIYSEMTVLWLAKLHGTPTLDFYGLTESKITKGTRSKAQVILDGYATEGGTRKIWTGFLYSWQIQLLETMVYDLNFQQMEVPTDTSNEAKLWIGELLVRLFLCFPLVAGWSRDVRHSSNYFFCFCWLQRWILQHKRADMG